MNPGTTLLDRGREGEALFSLSESGADFLPGLVTYNGTTVTVDLTSLGSDTQGLLVLQLINGDSDDGTSVTISDLRNAVDEEGVASPVFATDTRLAEPGSPVELSGLSPVTDGAIEVLVNNVRVDGEAGTYVADLHLMNTGELVSRSLVAVFKGLPAGVEVRWPRIGGQGR